MQGDVIGRRTRRHFAAALVVGLALACLLAPGGAGAKQPPKAHCGGPQAGSGGIDGLTGGPRADALAGGAARDSLDGGRGADCLSGGAGPDALSGGPGDDRLLAGSGDDQLLPGAGADRIRAGRGDDLVFARDGVAETVRCGPGRDLASADEDDVMRGCERVVLAAPEVRWYQLYMHLNAYGYSITAHNGWGSCDSSANKRKAACSGRSEEGNLPYNAGQEIRMEWEPSAYGGGQIATVKAPQTDSVLIGNTDPEWVWMHINAGWVGNWIDPNHGVIRTGVGGAPGTQGGPLQAFLGWHSYPSINFPPRKDGYSLDLRGWVKFIFIR
jgi:hypothetical protein